VALLRTADCIVLKERMPQEICPENLFVKNSD